MKSPQTLKPARNPPRYSVVIPTYNRRALLEDTLESVLRAADDRNDIEIIVADDGSTDGTSSLIEGLPASAEVLFVRQPDLGFRAARVRNLGMRIARGEYILLLDCGVSIRRNFFTFMDQRPIQAEAVIVCPVTGFSNDDLLSTQLAAAIRDADDSDKAQALAMDGRFPDIREPVYALCGDDLGKLPAPWAVAWTCCLLIPRTGLLGNVWFDETFVGWGGEDLDFALQLASAGATFTLERGTDALHLPHDKSETANTQSSAANKAYIHDKHGRAETDLLRTVSAVDLNQRLLERTPATR